MGDTIDAIRYATRGAIAEMTVPEGWSPQRLSSDGTAKFYYFQHPTLENIRLCFFYRGQPLSEPSAESLRDVLSQSPHPLAASDLEKISEAAENFQRDGYTLVATTEGINGKIVVKLKGTCEADGVECYAILIDVDGDGRWVAEMFFEATASDFHMHWPAIERSIKSIKWAAPQPVSG